MLFDLVFALCITRASLSALQRIGRGIVEKVMRRRSAGCQDRAHASCRCIEHTPARPVDKLDFAADQHWTSLVIALIITAESFCIFSSLPMGSLLIYHG